MILKLSSFRTAILFLLFLFPINISHAEQAKKSFESLLSDANNGNSDAQNRIGMMYHSGKMGANKRSEAFQWFEKSANNGNPAGMFNLGTLYYEGKGTLSNKSKGKELIQKAAIAGNPYAEYKIGTMYQSGEYNKKVDFAQAVYFVRMAAEKNLAEAQNRLGYFYSKGMGVEKNDKTAHEWFMSAAIQNHPKAQYNVAQDYFFGVGVNKDKDEAMRWYKKSAKGGFSDAKLKLSSFANSKGNDNEFYDIVNESANNGNPSARAMLSNIHMNNNGKITDKSPDEIFKANIDNAKAGDKEAQYQLGKMYLNMGNEAEGVKWIELAASQGHGEAIKLTQLNKNYYPSNNYIKKYNEQARELRNTNYENREELHRDLYLYGLKNRR